MTHAPGHDRSAPSEDPRRRNPSGIPAGHLPLGSRRIASCSLDWSRLGRVLGVVLAALIVTGCSRSVQIDNLVLVTIDTLRADHLGSYGYPRPTSPFLDSLAARGVRFDRAISASSHTAPSHTSIFTSFYPSQHGVLRNGRLLQEGLPTLASILHEAGFDTAGVTSVRFLKGISAGFDTFLAPHLGRGYRDADRTIDVAIDWLGTRTERRPFLLWVHLYDVHHSDPSAATKPALAPHLALMRQDAFERGQSLGAYLVSEHGTSEELIRDDLDQINRYDAQIRFVDSQLERLFDRVMAATEGESTLWILTSDHGEGLGSHEYLGHGKHLYDEQIRVPLIFLGASIEAEGRVVESSVRTVDLLPTIVDLFRLPTPPESARWEGRSLAGLLSAGTFTGEDVPIAYAERRPVDERRASHGWVDESVHVARDERSKYIRHSAGENEFYDLAADPLETKNRAGLGDAREERLARWLDLKIDSLPRSETSDIEALEVDEEFVEELRSLGYLD